MLRKMVNSHALRLVPGWNRSDLLHARSNASWTRSSATETEPEREIANARRFLISASSSSLKLAVGIAAPLRLGSPICDLETSQQLHESLRERRVNEIGVVSLERLSDGLHGLRIGRRNIWRLGFTWSGHGHRQHPCGQNAPHAVWFRRQQTIFTRAEFRRS